MAFVMPRKSSLKHREPDILPVHRDGDHRAAIPVAPLLRHLHRPPQNQLRQKPLRLRSEGHAALGGVNALHPNLQV
jgi:hypothetical protein